MKRKDFPFALMTTESLTLQQVQKLLNEAAFLRHYHEQGTPIQPLGVQDTLASLFFEPSTRTRVLTEEAICQLGGRVMQLGGLEGSSVMKGETAADTVRTFEAFGAKIIAMRHPDARLLAEAIEAARRPFINCGNGAIEHPTQALLDMLKWMHVFGGYTIGDQFVLGDFSVLAGRKIAICGDLKFGRTFGSGKWLYRLLGIEVILVCPEALQPPSCPELLKWSWTDNLDEAMGVADGVYMTRIQKERFEDYDPESKTSAEYEKYAGRYIMTPELLMRHPNIRSVLHPLPRVDEISTGVDQMAQAGYWDQMRWGLFLRQAVIKTMLEAAA